MLNNYAVFMKTEPCVCISVKATHYDLANGTIVFYDYLENHIVTLIAYDILRIDVSIRTTGWKTVYSKEA